MFQNDDAQKRFGRCEETNCSSVRPTRRDVKDKKMEQENASWPNVSLGMPVFNGDRYLAEAIDSILAQSYDEFELIISDNGSTDNTEQICQLYAASDGRIKYFRQNSNRGAAFNFNFVFEQAKGQYFKWAAHDDICAPDLLSKCVAVLDREPDTVLCFTKLVRIDEQGNVAKIVDYELANLKSPRPQKRFHDVILAEHGCEAVFGVIRSNVLEMTPLIGNYIASDLVLLSLLSLHGCFYELPERLFFHRDHSDRSIIGKPHEITAWFDPNKADAVVFPYWRLMLEYLRSIRRSPLQLRDRFNCYLEIGRWLKRNRKLLRWNVSEGIEQFLDLHKTRYAYRKFLHLIALIDSSCPVWLTKIMKIACIVTVEGACFILRFLGLKQRVAHDSEA